MGNRNSEARQISTQNTEGVIWVLLTAYGKVRKSWIEDGIVNKMTPELEDLENSQPIHTGKKKKKTETESLFLREY